MGLITDYVYLNERLFEGRKGRPLSRSPFIKGNVSVINPIRTKLKYANSIVRIFRSVSRFEFYTVQAKLCPIFCIAGIQGKPQGDCRRAENIALVNRYLGEYRYFLRKKIRCGTRLWKIAY